MKNYCGGYNSSFNCKKTSSLAPIPWHLTKGGTSYFYLLSSLFVAGLRAINLWDLPTRQWRLARRKGFHLSLSTVNNSNIRIWTRNVLLNCSLRRSRLGRDQRLSANAITNAIRFKRNGLKGLQLEIWCTTFRHFWIAWFYISIYLKIWYLCMRIYFWFS